MKSTTQYKSELTDVLVHSELPFLPILMIKAHERGDINLGNN